MSRYSQCLLALLSALSLDAARAEEAVDGVTQVAVGYAHSCALVQSGDVYCWGMETVNGQATISNVATKVEGLPRVKSISAGQVSSCAVDLEDRAWCWGVDLQTSIRSNEEVLSGPRLVSGLPAVVQTASGYLHNCAIARDDGAVWCWGLNAAGELGDGTTEDRADPVRAGAITGATHIDAGVNNSCAIVAGGAIYCWGTDSQSSEGVLINSTSPQHFDESRNATRVANGRNFVCSRQHNAQVICFGSNIMNQLGDRATGATYSLAKPKGLGPARDVDAGGFFACALVDTGDVFCWGNLPGRQENSLDGTDPQAVSGLAGVMALAVGFETACALQSDNRLLCWGNNQTGQVGTGLTGDYSTAPVEVVGLPGSDAALLHAARARGLQDSGKAQAALAEAYMAIALRPDRVALLLLRAAILRDLGQTDLAIEDLEKALAAEPDNAEALHAYGVLLFGQGRTDAAIAALERAIAIDQNDALSYVELGRIMLSVGEREQAGKNFSTARSIEPDIAQEYRWRGFEATLNENYDAAIANYDVAILLDPEDASLYADRADAYEAMGDTDKAEADRKRKASLEHASAEFDRLTDEGWSLYEADEFAKAIDVYTQALAIRPLDAHALWQRSIVYYEMENYEGAIADLDKAISINPEDAAYYFYRANSYTALGQVDKAIADYDMSLSLERDAYTYELRASANEMAGRVDDAIADYTSALELDPSPSTYSNRAQIYLRLGEYSKVIDDCDAALAINAEYSSCYIDIAFAQMALGNNDAAGAALKKLFAFDPENTDGLGVLARLDFLEGNFANSARSFEAAARDRPEDAYLAMWSELARRRAGEPRHLSEAAVTLDLSAWPGPLLQMYLGKVDIETVRNSVTGDEQLCEFDFYGGEWLLVEGRTEEARVLLGDAARICPYDYIEKQPAKVELLRIP